MRLRDMLWATATKRGENSSNNLPENALRVPETAVSSDHLMYAKNIKTLQHHHYNIDEGIHVGLQNRVQWRTTKTT